MMRLIFVVLLIYVVGIGVQLTPTVREGWNSMTAAQLLDRTAEELPNAAAWPMRAYESLTGQSKPAAPAPQPAPAPIGTTY